MSNINTTKVLTGGAVILALALLASALKGKSKEVDKSKDKSSSNATGDIFIDAGGFGAWSKPLGYDSSLPTGGSVYVGGNYYDQSTNISIDKSRNTLIQGKGAQFIGWLRGK